MDEGVGCGAAAGPGTAAGRVAGHVMTTPMPSTLPPSLVGFMEDNDLAGDVYEGADDIDRHIRINPHRPVDPRELEEQLGVRPRVVPWLPDILSLPPSVKIASCAAYRQASFYGIDLSSAAAVKALAPQPGDIVLDLCCAPGAKLCMIADMVSPPSASSGNCGFVVGVDVSGQRLASCRSIIKKYDQKSVRLYLGDGQTLAVPCPSRTSQDIATAERKDFLRRLSESNKGSRKGRGSRKRKCGEEARPQDVQGGEDVVEGTGGGGNDASASAGGGTDACGVWLTEFFHEGGGGGGAWTWKRGCTGGGRGARGSGEQLCECTGYARFDRVLVDAECTHDGSVKHVAKLAGGSGGEDASDRAFRDKVFSEERTASLRGLQRGLLLNGFEHLRPGGALVYSTCSFSRKQNDEIVQWLLDTQSSAAPCAIEGKGAAPCSEGDADHVMRFLPAKSKSSGLYIAKLTKRL